MAQGQGARTRGCVPTWHTTTDAKARAASPQGGVCAGWLPNVSSASCSPGAEEQVPAEPGAPGADMAASPGTPVPSPVWQLSLQAQGRQGRSVTCHPLDQAWR